MHSLRSRAGRRSHVAAIAGVLCLLLSLLTQAADFVHDHPERLGCEIEHPADGEGECQPCVHVTRLVGAPSIDDADHAGPCLVCRWSRGPLLQGSQQASVGAPGAPRPFALAGPLAAPRLSQRSGFLNRAPPAAA